MYTSPVLSHIITPRIITFAQYTSLAILVTSIMTPTHYHINDIHSIKYSDSAAKADNSFLHSFTYEHAVAKEHNIQTLVHGNTKALI
jgi:hypothetical protein